MNDKSEIQRRQEDELISLQAIYCDAIEDCRKSINSWKPLEVKVKVYPQGDDGIHVSCCMYVNCGPNYPITTPQEISIIEAQGLSSKLIKELKDRLLEVAYKRKGDEVIYDLIDCTKTFLTQNNDPSPTSIYDEMVLNQRREQEEEEKKRQKEIKIAQIKNEATNKYIQEEIQRKQLVLRQESRLRRDSYIDDVYPSSPRRNFHFNDDKSLSARTVCQSGHKSVHLKLDSVSPGSEGKQWSILRANCVLHDPLSDSISYLAIDEYDGFNYILIEWVVSLKNFDVEPKQVFNTLKSYSNEINRNVVSLGHPNLIVPLAFNFEMEKERSLMRLLLPWIPSSRLSDLPSLMKGEKLKESHIKKVMLDVLEGLIYLHHQGIFHGDLRASFIFLDSKDGLCKLSNFYVDSKIRSIKHHLNSQSSDSFPAVTEDTDIYRFGLLLLWLSTGWQHSFLHLCTLSTSELITNYLTGSEVSTEVSDLVSKCLRVNIFNDMEEIRSDFFFYQPGRSRTNTETLSPIIYHTSRRNTASHPPIDNTLKDEESEKSSKLWLTNLISTQSGHSRLTDYQIICKLGAGGFGEVYKVRNKLDQCHYALKKIPINASNSSINRKIIREVKYLSKLNHENVVRYYGAWVESESLGPTDESDSSDKTSDSTLVTQRPAISSREEIEEPIGEESSEDESSDEELFSVSKFRQDKSAALSLAAAKSFTLSENYVQFKDDHSDVNAANESITKESILEPKKREKRPQFNHVMYIQMELCEKNTLWSAINSGGLVINPSRRHRLFREIVEGLVHIHELGIIHRDLKPGNIFLDSRDHVKIGDFGLATRSEISAIGDLGDSIESYDVGAVGGGGQNESKQTGIVGTYFYMAPELKKTRTDGNVTIINYNQKVDIYSLGIIYFEMCYPPTNTKSERVRLLTNLREPEIILPNDVEEHLSQEEIKLLKVLLDHDGTQRPSSDELLNSSYLPPPQIEEEEQKNVIREVVFNPQSKAHHYMLNLLFKRESDVVEDFVYDFNETVTHRDPCKRAFANPCVKQRVFEFVTSTLSAIFHRYGAVKFSVSTFMPYLSAKKYKTDDVFRLMDGTGSVLCPPYDLRVPFARYIASNKLTNLRRYSIEKVFRGRKMRYHPKEIYECAFDIVSPKLTTSAAIIPEFEVINLLNDITHEFRCLKGKSFILRLNHVDLILGLLTYYEVPAEKQLLAMEIITESANKSRKYSSYTREALDDEEESVTFDKLSRSYLVKMFRKENITKTTKINHFMKVLELEKESIEDLKSTLEGYLRKKQPHHLKGLQMVMDSIGEMEEIIENLRASNNSFTKIRFSPLLINRYYSGLIFQLEEEVTNKKNVKNILAIGGRYDQLIRDFQVHADFMDEDKTGLMAVGFSLGVEQIVRFAIEDEYCNSCNLAGVCDVIIWSSENDRNLVRDMNRITRELRANGVRTIPFPEDSFSSVESLNNFCEENRVKYSVIVSKFRENINQKDACSARIFHIDREKRIVERKSGKTTINEIVENIKGFLGLKENSHVPPTSDGSHQRTDFTSTKSSGQLESPGIINSNPINFGSLSSCTNIRFYPSENKSLLSQRKRYINQINSLLSSTISSISNNSTIDVFALDLPFKIVKSIVGEIDFGDTPNPANNRMTFDQSVKLICEKYPRHRSYIQHVMDAIYSFKVDKKSPLITLVSYNEMQLVIFT